LISQPKALYGAITPLNAQLNPICHLLALLGAHHIIHVNRVRVNMNVLFLFVYTTEINVTPTNNVNHFKSKVIFEVLTVVWLEI